MEKTLFVRMKRFLDDKLVSSKVHMLCISRRIDLSIEDDNKILSKRTHLGD